MIFLMFFTFGSQNSKSPKFSPAAQKKWIFWFEGAKICESNLFQAQQDRREKQSEIRLVQNKLKEIHSELDRTLRGEDKYLRLITDEHAAIKKEREMMNIYEELETKEREAFNVLSNKVRVSHEREREREERTKYWSLIGSLFGALLGILGTTIATELRMKHIREMIPSGQEIKPLLDEMVQMVRGSQGQVSEFLENLTKMFNLESPMLLNSKNKFNENNVDITGNDFIKILGGLKEQVFLLKLIGDFLIGFLNI
ncbi:unnamed protein product [Meloidogyne enterolobii]|uniref:Uncharacterized protein n=1 Tax=Meloidogyne enterolobii TaxID=390850 RepID=A0ACB0YUY2_MELEN